MKISDYIVEILRREGIKKLFGYQGGAITKIIDAIGKQSEINFIETYHEQAAAFAAEGYARVTGNLGVAIATSGPGATNLITGIGSSYFDSTACLYITGQVNSTEYKQSDEIRQVGFQETDIVSIVKPITKFATTIWQANQIRWYLEKAIYIAKEGRPGPVLLDIPMDIQDIEINPDTLESYYQSEEYINKESKKNVPLSKENVIEIFSMMRKAQRPLLLIGGGIRSAQAVEELNELLALMPIPVVSTLMGLDSINHKRKEYVGFIGAYGNRYANLALANADLILVLGARLTSRQTSTLPQTFARGALIIQVDIDTNELGRVIKGTLQVHQDLKCFLSTFIHYIKQENKLGIDEAWHRRIETYKKVYSLENVNESGVPNELMYMLGEMLPDDTIICTDVGQNQIWVAQSMVIREKQRLLTSGGMGAMGFALPSAIGAFMAKEQGTVCAIAGDGGFQMNIQELQTIIREHLPIKIFVMNNRCLGMIRQFQELYFEGRYEGTVKGYLTPEFTAIGKAYGIESIVIKSKEQLKEIKPYLIDKHPYLFEIELEQNTYVKPKLGMGRPIEDQEPLLSREELRRNMLIPLWGD